MQEYKNIIVLGAAFGGQCAAMNLAEGLQTLPGNWRVIAIDRNTHINHVYAFPRFAVVGGYEHHAFIRYTDGASTDKTQRLLNLTASVVSLSPYTVTLDRAFPEHGIPTPELAFEYALYTLGASLPAPVNLWGPRLGAELRADPESLAAADDALVVGSKAGGIFWLKAAQGVIRKARSVLVVGGGALGIQFATDIADVYPEKRVTLLHSRAQLLPRFSPEMHEEVSRQMQRLKVNVVLSERIDPRSIEEKKYNDTGELIARTTSGRELAADLVLVCTGQKPNTEVLRAMDPTILVEDGRARVKKTMQLDSATYPHIFAAGDCAHAFGAICSGRNANAQGCLAARNILRLIAQKETPESESAQEQLELYSPAAPLIKVTLGLYRSVSQSNEKVTARNEDGKDDRRCAGMWRLFGHGTDLSDEYMRS